MAGEPVFCHRTDGTEGRSRIEETTNHHCDREDRMSIFRDPDAPRMPPFALTLGRRTFLAGTAALAATAALGDVALAQNDRIVVAAPGGPFGTAFKAAFHDSFKADTGITSVQIAREHEPTAQVATMV